MAININIPSQVVNYANLAAFPASGSLKTIYIAEDTNKTYRWTGSVYVEISASAAIGLTVGTTPIASGTIGRVLFQGTGNVLQQSGNLFWDSTNNRLGIGTSSPTTKINIVTPNNGDALRLEVPSTNSTVYDFYLGNLDNSAYIRANTRILELRRQGASSIIRTVGGVLNDLALQADGGITLSTYGTNERMRVVGSTGNVLIGTTTDAGFRLDVNGTSRYSGIARFQNTSSNWLNIDGSSSGTNNCVISNRFNQIQIVTNTGAGDPHIALLPATGGNVGIGTSTPTAKMHIIGVGTTNATESQRIVNGSDAVIFLAQDNLDVRIGKDIAAFQRAYSLASGASFPAYSFSGNSGTGLYQDGANTVGISTGNTSRLQIASTGNVLINTTTDAGYKLDVNGTARVTGTGSTALTNAFIIRNSSGQELFRVRDDGNTFNSGGGGLSSVGIIGTAYGIFGNLSYSASVVLGAQSTTAGFLPPRMTTTQKNAIATPETGLQIYDSTLNRPCFYDGTTWITL